MSKKTVKQEKPSYSKVSYRLRINDRWKTGATFKTTPFPGHLSPAIKKTSLREHYPFTEMEVGDYFDKPITVRESTRNMVHYVNGLSCNKRFVSRTVHTKLANGKLGRGRFVRVVRVR